MYQMKPFQAQDHDELKRLGGEGIGGHLDMAPEMLKFMATHPSWTLFYNGNPVCAGGYVPLWPGRYLGWAFLNTLTPKHMLPITRYSRKVMALPVGRVEISVRSDFAPGQRWAELLGFKIETPLLRAYGPKGEDHIGYVRFNGV